MGDLDWMLAFPIKPTCVEPLSGRMFATHYRVTTENGQTWFLKANPIGYTLEHAEMPVLIGECLSAEGFPCARLIRSTCGQPGVVWHSRVYTCAEWVNHDDLVDPTPFQKGLWLGQIHQHLRRLTWEHDCWGSSIRDLALVAKPVEDLMAIPRHKAVGLDDYIHPHEIAVSLNDLGSLNRSLAPLQVLHGDYSAEHLLTHSGQLVACIDFTDTIMGNVLEDVAEGALNFCASKEAETWTPNWTSLSEFLRGYSAFGRLVTPLFPLFWRVLRAVCMKHLSKYTDHLRLLVRYPGTPMHLIRLLGALHFSHMAIEQTVDERGRVCWNRSPVLFGR